MRRKSWLIVLSVAFLAACLSFVLLTYSYLKADKSGQAATSATVASESGKIVSGMKDVLSGFRKIIVLLADEKTMSPEEKKAANAVAYMIYSENSKSLARLETFVASLAESGDPLRFAIFEVVLTWLETDGELYDADRLAFRETLRSLQKLAAKDQSLSAVKLHKRVSEDLAALDEIEANYDKELKQIFSRFGQRSLELKRERWDDYVAKLKAIYSREKILKDYGTILPEKGAELKSADEAEITGFGLPPKTLALTFDDGPHGTYTEEIAGILDQYGISGVFFQLGSNLGTIDKDEKPKLGRLSQISKNLEKSGHVLANHSFNHLQLSKVPREELKTEIRLTELLLSELSSSKSGIFRFPYGARTKESLEVLDELGLTSVLWNVDSKDWADPVPNSIAERVLSTVEEEGRGVVLFHDINARTVKALPTILEKLGQAGYTFARWDGTAFVTKSSATMVAAPRETPSTGYRESYAVVIGIDDYQKWPKLQYAANDADAIKELLTTTLGFSPDKVFTLKNQEATRANILNLIDTKLGQSDIQRDDRVLVFFSGHGTTRKLSSGRNLGYIIPVDSDPESFSTDAIAMSDLQNVGENLKAKHVFFIMDSCYSGLGLTRGGTAKAYLADNSKRLARQMLTAGGTDQMVADGGPGGHSIFTWTLIQGLKGKADLNQDGYIMATELAAYIAPAVASVSLQTPAFGSLPGSEGGEFVFELPLDDEFLNPETTQLDNAALALNLKIDESLKDLAAPLNAAKKIGPFKVAVQTLDGGTATLTTAKPAALPPRLSAQRAVDRGLRHYFEAKYKEAEDEFTQALKIRPDFALAANNLGFVYFKQSKFAEAARWFENTIKMDPSRAIAYYNLGDAYLRTKENDKAKQAFATYLELAPNSGNSARVREVLATL